MNDDEHCYPFTITVRDRFGDFGLINVVILQHRGDALEIDTFLMSCRVLKRGVEQFAMNQIFEYARANNFKRVIGRYIPTAKNMMVERFYADFEFTEIPSGGGEGTLWSKDVTTYEPRTVFIQAQEQNS
jgi:FkbH-like protein